MRGPLRISIALCACEGEKHLPDQLESIRGQTRRPDEIVLCDDASGDGTAAIVERFLREAPVPVRAVRNAQRLGVAKNFEQAIGLCTGEVIALSDQDDVWRPEKLARIGELFSRDAALGAVFTDGDVVDESLRPLGYRLWRAHRPNAYQRRCLRRGDAFGALLNRNLATGATMAFRSAFRPLVLPIPEAWVHDAWIALLIAAVAKVEAVPAPLIQYRRHAAQQIGAARKGVSEQLETAARTGAGEYGAMAERFREALDRLRSRDGVPARVLQAVEAKIAHLLFRAERGSAKAPLSVVGECLGGRYRRYSDGWKSVAKDLFMPGRGGC